MTWLPYSASAPPRRNLGCGHALLAVALLSAAVPAAAASAATPTDLDTSKAARERAARRACLTGDADGGVAILADLYIDTRDLNYLFNQGRCFEQNRRYEDAIGRFREYLIKSNNLRPDEHAEVQRHINACESYLRKPTEEAKPEPRPSVVETSPVVAPPVEPTQVVEAVPEPAPAASGQVMRISGLVLGGLGVGGLVTGLVLNLKANSMSDELEEQYDPDRDSTRKSYKIGARIGYGAGAASLAAGAILYTLGWYRDSRGGSVALVPTVGSNMAGTVLMGVF